MQSIQEDVVEQTFEEDESDEKRWQMFSLGKALFPLTFHLAAASIVLRL